MPPPMNVSNDGMPDDVKRSVPVEFKRVPDGNRLDVVDTGTTVGIVVVVVVVVVIFDDETFFLNDMDIAEIGRERERERGMCEKSIDVLVMYRRSKLVRSLIDMFIFLLMIGYVSILIGYLST
jgi:hypothetical protein